MWLQEFRHLFRRATELYTSQPQDLDALERELEPARRAMRVGPSELRILEESPHWTYAKWWPRRSSEFGAALALPASLIDEKAKRKAADDLDKRLKHIEVVSVVLRFICPEEFGIISPPVVSLLNLVPTGDPVKDYLRYLKVLQHLRREYRVLPRLADIDMALWAAAHLSFNPNPRYIEPTQEMRNDEFFHELRLRNLLEGLRKFPSPHQRERLLLAAAIIPHDHQTAALIAARALEGLLNELAKGLKTYPNPKPRQTRAGNLVEQLDERPELRSIGLSAGDLRRLWDWRNNAVHGELDIKRTNAEEFVRRLRAIWKTLPAWPYQDRTRARG